MNIVHFSDIHLSKGNIVELRNNLLDALIKDLYQYLIEKKIDLIVITGDLVDQGGHSLLELKEFEKFENPFEVFEEYFINPLSECLNISKSKFLFVPGNHDIDESEILWKDEKNLKNTINEENVNNFLAENISEFNSTNKRIEKFKTFEKKFHMNTPNYYFSNNQSTFIYTTDSEQKVGFILINDAWRCSTCKVENSDLNNHYIGIQQFYSGLEKLKQEGTKINICLFHHSIESVTEFQEIKRFLVNREIDFFLYGHSHNQYSQIHFNSLNGCFGFRGRATINKPDEKDISYQPGYQIFELNIPTNRIQKILFKKYDYIQQPY